MELLLVILVWCLLRALEGGREGDVQPALVPVRERGRMMHPGRTPV
jgi:hypothetical protein